MFPPSGVIQQQAPVTFDSLVLGAAPYAYYDFQQDMSAGQQLLDRSGNARHLTAWVAGTGPSHGAAARSTTYRSAWWGSTADGAPATRSGTTYCYHDPSGAVLHNVMFYPGDTNQTRVTLMWSMKYEPSMGQFVKIIGWRDSNNSTRFVVYTQYPSGTGHTVEFRTALNHTTNIQYEYGGNWTRDTNWHIATMRFDGGNSGSRSFFLDGVKQGEWATAYSGNNSIYSGAATTSPFEFPGTFSSGGACYMKSDAVAMWDRAVSDADILAMHDKYISELI